MLPQNGIAFYDGNQGEQGSSTFSGSHSALTELDYDSSRHTGFARSTHSHSQSDITNLTSDLAGKAAVSHTQNANTVIIPNGIGSPSFDDLQDFLQETRSGGKITGGLVTAHSPADGTADVSELQGTVFTLNALGSPYIFFKMAAASGIALTDNAVNWIYYDYNGGNPRYLATTDRTIVHNYDQFVVGRVWRSGNEVEVQESTGHNIYNRDRRAHNRLIDKYGNMDRASGADLTAHATPLRLSVSAGNWFTANTPFSTLAKDTFEVWYKNGSSTWVLSSELTLFSEIFDGGTGTVYTRYQNGNSLAALGTSKYGVYWIFQCPEGDIYVVLGTSSYNTAGAAQAASVPSTLPPYCVNWARLIGKIIVQNSGAAFYSVESVWAQAFTLSAAVDHASLANLSYGLSGHTGFAETTHSHSQSQVTGLETALSLKADASINISVTSPLTGGGGLTQSMTISLAATALRTRLTTTRTYYVRIDGNNSNDGLTNSAAGAFLTPQAAVNAYQELDCAGNPVYIKLGPGTYSSGFDIRFRFGSGNLYIDGDSTTASNVFINVTSSNAILVYGHPPGSTIYLSGMKLQTNVGGYGITVGQGSIVMYGSMEFGACAAGHIESSYGATVRCNGNYIISGSSLYHWLSQEGGRFYLPSGGSRTVTLTGTPNFSVAFIASLHLANSYLYNMTFSGSATGVRYIASGNSVIDTGGGGANFFPGNSAGSVASGGQYL